MKNNLKIVFKNNLIELCIIKLNGSQNETNIF